MAIESLFIGVGVRDTNIFSLGIIKNILNVPKLSTSLLSVRKLIKDINFWVIIDNHFCDVYDKVTNKKIMC